MKKPLFTFFCLLLLPLAYSLSQGVWTQKASMFLVREGGAGFSIGNKGYIGLGCWCGGFYNDLWEYDPTMNIWTQKANFPGTGACCGVCFTVGNSAYVGTGGTSHTNLAAVINQFWQWNQVNNTWIARANFPGTARAGAVAFSIGSFGYVGMGFNGISYENDCWKWNASANSWSQAPSFLANPGAYGTAFSINQKGYVVTGINMLDQFFEFDPVNGTWTQMADFIGGASKWQTVSFSIGNSGFVGLGKIINGAFCQEFFRWDQATNSWSQVQNYPPGSRGIAAAFSIGNKGYVGTGNDSTNTQHNDFWEFVPTSTGIPESETKIEYTLYPNPMSTEAVLQIQNANGKYQNMQFEMFDMQGKQVRQTTINEQQTTIPRGNLSAGNYIYKIKSENKTLASGKLIIL